MSNVIYCTYVYEPGLINKLYFTSNMHAFPVLFMAYEYFFIDSKVTAELNKREELQVELKNQKEEMKTTVRMFWILQLTLMFIFKAEHYT